MKADAEAPGRIFQMLTDGHNGREFPKASLPRVARELGVPKGSFVEWFTSEHAALYESALKVVAADLAIKAAEAALDATVEDVAVRRLQAETFLKLASRFDRARYGEQAPVARSAVVVMDWGLMKTAGELLDRLAVERLPMPEAEKVVEKVSDA